MFEELIKEWDGEQVVVHFDRPTGAWMFIGVHSTRLGPAAGGTRMKTYPTPADGLRDALRLSSAMTRKLAGCDLPFGGGKAVLAVPGVPSGGERQALLGRYAALVDSLHGTYLTAPDVNTNESDMDFIGARTPHVFGRSVAAGGSGSTAPATAAGVFAAICAAVEHEYGSATVAGKLVLVQGVGEVGRRLVALLANTRANVLVSDVDEARVRTVADEYAATPVPLADALATPCDVLAPCALGGVLNEQTIPRLRCRIVTGAANNQLLRDQDAELLRERGILYTPDYIANAGGVIHGICLEQLGWTAEQVHQRVEAIGDTVREIYRLAERDGISTERAAERIVDARLAGAVTAG